MDSSCIMAVDLGGSRLRVALFRPDGEILSKTATDTDLEDPGQLVRTMRAELANAPGAVIRAVVGIPGLISYADGRILRLPNLPRWQDAITRDRLEGALDLPVMLANDADLAALGEHRYGAGRGVQDMLYVTSSTGVGAGVVIGGRLLHGRYSLAEGGHTVIDYRSGGTLEELGSGSALERLTRRPGEAVTRAAAGGDTEALAAVRLVAEALAVGVHNLVHCFMPERVVLGGGFALGAGDLVLGPVRGRIEGCDLRCPVTPGGVVAAEGGDNAGLLGGLALALDAP